MSFNIKRLSKSLSTRLQTITIVLSLVGIAFGVKSYLHVLHEFGAEASRVFLTDLLWQLAFGVVLNIVASYIIYRIATKPIRALGEVMRALTEGKLETMVPYTQQGTEIGSMARKVEIFKKNAIDKERMEAEQKIQELRTKEEKAKAMNDMADTFEHSIGSVVTVVGAASSQVNSSAQALTSIAEATTRQAKAVSGAMQEASLNVQTVASATEEMASSITEIARRVNEASAIAGEAVGEAKLTHRQMQELSEASSKIGDVVNLISKIAAQTNLLALNATIEAARAGDMGKGFAVVASEVKNLASQTAKATEDIQQKIAGIQKATDTAVHGIDRISGTIERIDGIQSSIASAVEEQGATTKEISRNIQEAASRTMLVSNNIDDVTKALEGTGAAAQEMMGAATGLSEQSGKLKQEVDSFLSSVRGEDRAAAKQDILPEKRMEKEAAKRAAA